MFGEDIQHFKMNGHHLCIKSLKKSETKPNGIPYLAVTHIAYE